MRIVIASRKSDLARIQAYHIADKIKVKHPEVKIEHNFSASFGDKNLDISLFKMPEKGSFTQDFREGLEDRSFDMVVHSWKDLPTDIAPTSLIHTVEREDARDVLLIKKENLRKVIETQSLEVLTSSPRRMYGLELELRDLLPGNIQNINYKEVRGNIPTRLRKLIEGDSEALVIAKAALDRMLLPEREEFNEVAAQTRKYLDECHWLILPLSIFPTAAAQGALAIESHKDNTELTKILKSIHDEETYNNVKKERTILRSYGGGCHQKIGISIKDYGFGEVKSLVGLTSKDEVLKEYALQDINENDDVNSENYWPKSKGQRFFERKVLKESLPQSDYWISRENALPQNYVQEDSALWCAGVSTWKKLAKRGYWLNGCSDGLGESINQRLDLISGHRKWTKLSHDKAHKSKYDTIATYSLEPKEIQMSLDSYDEYYWMSATQLEEAFKQAPQLKDKKHFSGPGFTHELLVKYVGKKKSNIDLSFSAWKQKRNKGK